MPSVLRRSGTDYVKDGQTITPRAAVHFCEVCGWEGAPFGDTSSDGKRLYFCGFQDNRPLCINRGKL